MLHIATSRLFFSGFIATFVMTMMVLPVFSANVLALELGIPEVSTLIIHFFCGVFLFPYLYRLSIGRWSSISPFVGGLLWGFILWLVAQSIVLPTLSYGFFANRMSSGNVFVPLTLFFFCIYGVLFGASLGFRAPMREKFT